MPVDCSVIYCILQGIRLCCLAEITIQCGIHDKFLAKLLLLHCPRNNLEQQFRSVTHD